VVTYLRGVLVLADDMSHNHRMDLQHYVNEYASLHRP